MIAENPETARTTSCRIMQTSLAAQDEDYLSGLTQSSDDPVSIKA